MTRLLRYWAPSVSEVEQTNRMKTKQYANGLEDDDVDVFCAARSVLYFVVKKAAWNRSVDEYTPESRVVKLHCNVPKFDIARECFSTEIEEASVEIVNEGCCINHGKIGAANVPVPLGSPFPKRLQNDQWLLVAILLHDYDVVFANYGKPVYEVSQTKLSTFTISMENIISMQMLLCRGIDKRKDICAVFPIELEIKKHVQKTSPSISHTVCAPTLVEVREALSAQVVTDDQKKLDFNSYFE